MLPLDYIFQPSHFFHVQYFLIQSNLPYATTQNTKPEGSLTGGVFFFHKNRTTGGLFREEVQAHLLYEG